MVDSQTGATISSASATQGSCIIAGTITCSLGTMAAGSSATITVTLKPSAQTVNQATVQASTGTDPNPANNTASVTTALIPLSSTTDLQVVGAAQNGGPSVTGTDTFTWQIKNNQSLTANAVVFSSTLASGMVFESASSNLGSCTLPLGSAGASLSCNLASLSGGQTMIVTVNVAFNATGSMSTLGQVTFNGTDNNPANSQASIVIGVK